MVSATRSTFLGSAACVAIAFGLLAGGGSASAATDATATATPGILQHAVAPAQTAEATTYWTPARMKAATTNAFVDPDPAKGDPPTSLSGDTPAQLRTSAVSAPAVVAGLDESAPVPGHRADDHLGVVFFRSGGVDQRCTGNAVVSSSGDLVATAGRCVSALKDAFVTDLAFVPQYDGTAPQGVWAATAITAPSKWVTGREVEDDTAFFQVQAPAGAAAGATLSSVVGASGVAFGTIQDDETYRSTGYPLDGGYDGTKAVAVESTTEPNPWMNRDDNIEGIAIAFRSGISGSPWVNVDDDPVVDVQHGMTSFAYHHFADDAFGPQWTDLIHATYRAAATA